MIKIINQDELDAFIVKYNATWPGLNGENDAMAQIKKQVEDSGFRSVSQIHIIKNYPEYLDFHGKPRWQVVMFVVRLELEEIDDQSQRIPPINAQT
jgi:hypothetical protein